MSGFIVTIDPTRRGTALPVSLGGGETLGEYFSGGRWLGVLGRPGVHSFALRRFADGVGWIDGIPRLWPTGAQGLVEWLAVVDGSFRCVFFPDSGGVRLIADPYGSRAIHYSTLTDAPCASDKLASLALLNARLRTVRWGPILEAMAVGCVLSTDTSLVDAMQVPSGCMVDLQTGQIPRVTRYRELEDGCDDEKRGLPRDAACLVAAVRSAVGEVWTRKDYPLLLSGGFDSRWILSLAGSKRRAVTLAPGDCSELRVARQVAQLCEADHSIQIIGEEKWLRMLGDGVLLVAGLFDPLKNHLLESGARLAADGVRGVAHGYLFDTVMKGYFAYPWAERNQASALPSRMTLAAEAVYTGDYVCALWACLSKAGREVLIERLIDLQARMGVEDAGDFDFGFERVVRRHISRQIDHPMSLGLMEYLDVQAPIFHRKIWEWWWTSSQRYRKPCLAYLLAFLATGGCAAWVRKGDTNQLAAVMMSRALGRGIWSKARSWMGRAGGAQSGKAATIVPQVGRSAWGLEDLVSVMRREEMRERLVQGVSALADVDVFDAERIDELAASSGGMYSVDPHLVCILASAGLWKRHVMAPLWGGGGVNGGRFTTLQFESEAGGL